MTSAISHKFNVSTKIIVGSAKAEKEDNLKLKLEIFPDNFHENRDVFACLCPQECDTKSFTTTTNRINYRREEFGVANFTIDSF